MKKNILMLLSLFMLSNVNALNVADTPDQIMARGFRCINVGNIQARNLDTGVVLNFNLYDVPSGGRAECGFASLGLSREDAINGLMNNGGLQYDYPEELITALDNHEFVNETAIVLSNTLGRNIYFIVRIRGENVIMDPTAGVRYNGAPIYLYNTGNHWQRAFLIER